MRLSDIADMSDYLEHRCYCPHEIYDISGFFFQSFTPDTECIHLIGGARHSIHGDFVVAQASERYKPQIIYIEHDNGYVQDCIRLDATEHNIKEIKMFMLGEKDYLEFDEYKKGAAAQSLSELSNLADAVMVTV